MTDSGRIPDTTKEFSPNKISFPKSRASKVVNLVLSGGGIKGIAFVGAIEVVENRGYQWGNIAGVSAGAVAGAFLAAGYKAGELRSIMEEFDFGSIELSEVSKRLSSFYHFHQLGIDPLTSRGMRAEDFFRYMGPCNSEEDNVSSEEFMASRSGMIHKIVTYSKVGHILDGDCLEEWLEDVLKRKGIRTFGDLRGGIPDKVNPKGYKVRMTCVDANRKKVIVLPDDLEYYKIDPDSFPVPKAIRMSTCVPFAFKPVELKFTEKETQKTHYFIDGGVFDNFPFWLIDNMKNIVKIGFRLDGGNKKKFLSLDTPLTIFKSLVSAVNDIGIPKKVYNLGYVAKINTSKVSFLDFKLSQEEKEYLYQSGKKASTRFVNNLEHMGVLGKRRNRFGFRIIRL
ncbi:MAG: patatin-like phospholipase family protein [Clostridia bacterium]|nr:patatin-like phospholipase family protein [Clostridia bacterium]